MSDAVLRKIEKRLDKKLSNKARNALSETYNLLGCNAIAREIKAGRNVTGNAEYGIRFCVHDKVGPRCDPATGKFTPMSKRGREMEHKFIENVNHLLEYGNYKPISSNVISKLRKQDRAFKKKCKRRR